MPKLQRKKTIVEKIGEKTVLTETRYPQENTGLCGETDTLACN